MFAIAFALLFVCQLPDQAGASIEGVWNIVGNKYRGTLEIKIGPDNTLTGKIYDQAIKGKWNPSAKQFEFTRFQFDKEIQNWQGELRADPKDSNAPMILSGKFSSVAGPYFGENDKSHVWTGQRVGKDGLYIGMPAIGSVVANFVTGEKAGKTMCPILLERQKTKIAIFARQLNAPVLSLVKSVDEIVAVTPLLKSSFVFLSHENSPTPTDSEYDTQLAEIRRLAAENSIKHLPIGLMIRIPDNSQNTRARPSLGFFGDGNIVVMLISPDKSRNHAVVRYFNALESEVTKVEIDRVCSEIELTLEELKIQDIPPAIGAVSLQPE